MTHNKNGLIVTDNYGGSTYHKYINEYVNPVPYTYVPKPKFQSLGDMFPELYKNSTKNTC
jgi:hypothetical protein